MKKILPFLSIAVVGISLMACTIETQVATIEGWQNYTYKNMSLQYPPGWVVVFDSAIANQPNGFDLHVIPDDQKNSLQPSRGLWLSTYSAGNKAASGEQFTGNDEQQSLSLNSNNTKLYVGCANYTKEVINVETCNKILSTIKISN